MKKPCSAQESSDGTANRKNLSDARIEENLFRIRRHVAGILRRTYGYILCAQSTVTRHNARKGDIPMESHDLASLGEHLASLDERLAELDARARHREVVIDRLHEENRLLREGERRSLLDPLITDLIRLHEQLAREATRLSEQDSDATGALLDSLADDVLLALERAAIEPIRAQVGEPFRADLHQPSGTVDDPDPERNNTVAHMVCPGFRDTVTGRIRSRIRVRFFRHTPALNVPSTQS